MRFFIFLCFLFFLSSCGTSGKVLSNKHVPSLKLLGEFELPHSLSFDGTVVGGLSGIDYNAARDEYYMICDDPSVFSPARFYTAKIPLTEKGIDSVHLIKVTVILNKDGQPYPDIRKDRIHSADLEAMRYDASRDQFVRSSEGQRILNKDKKELQDPDVVIMNREGKYIDTFVLPANMHMQETEKGPRHNSVLEGVAFSRDYKNLFVSVEDALYDDGGRAGNGDTTAWIRVMKFDRDSKQQTAQFAYQIDPVPFPANPPGAFKINGVSDIMTFGDDQFIIVERGYSVGRLPSDIRLYYGDARKASNVAGIPSLTGTAKFQPIRKKLILNMTDLGRYIDNVEGITFGPVLPGNRQTLLLVADDNFDKKQRSQFFLFEIIP